MYLWFVWYYRSNTYIQAEVGDKTWVEEVLSNPNNIYKALIYKDGKAHIF